MAPEGAVGPERRRVPRRMAGRRVVDEPDPAVAERRHVRDGVLDGGVEVDVDERQAFDTLGAPDHREGEAGCVQRLDPRVLQAHLHEQDAVGHALVHEVPDLLGLPR